MTGRLEPATTELDWDTLNRWLPVLAGDFDPGAWTAPQQLADGVVAMGYVALSEQALAFVQELYDERVIVGFDWPRWMEDEGRRLYEHPDLLSDASLDDCRRLLIALVRGDRFNEGILLQAFDDGTIRQVLTRTAELTAA